MKHYRQFRIIIEAIECLCGIVAVFLLAWFIYQILPFFPVVD